MRGVAAAIIATAWVFAGCGDKHVRECGGGVEVRITLADAVAATTSTVRVDLTAEGATRTRTFAASEFVSGVGSFVVQFATDGAVAVRAAVYALDSTGSVIAVGVGDVTSPAGDSGCSLLAVETSEEIADGTVPDARLIDGRVADAAVSDAAVNDANVNDAGAMNDEDSDGWFDQQDNCPGIANPGQEDIDGDDVGDVCDPHPNDTTVWLDSREYFNGFNSITAFDDLATPSGTWTIADGAAVQSQLTGAAVLQYFSFNTGAVYVETRVAVTQLAPGGVSAKGAAVRLGLGSEAGWQCLARYNPVQALRLLEPDGTGLATGVLNATENVPYTLQFQLDFDATTDLNCKFNTFEVNGADTNMSVGNVHSLETIDATARFEYIFIVRSIAL